MNTPASHQGNLVRITIFAVVYFIVFGVKYLAANVLQANIWGWLLLVIVAAVGIWFHIRQFNHEEQFFVKQQRWPLLTSFTVVAGAVVLITALRILIAYLTMKQRLPESYLHKFYLQHEAARLFWLLIAADGVIMPVMQTYLTIGFFFNYWFRDSNLVNAVLGIIASGLLFMLLHWQLSVPLLIMNACLGMLLAWTYLYTQNIAVPMFLAIINGLLQVVLL
ncbi:MAG: CPBP family intramembrane metalloprotease [Lactobacillus sp.]|jgi:membrane protease YdiL (CAAX protease family)|nr:CPBP family intramembrane metalloprotease [Lactobacillus sp.]